MAGPVNPWNVSADELRDLFDGFDVDDIHVDAVEHLCLTGVKRPTNR